MRVLLVSHRFPPAHTAGTEVYTQELAGHLAAAGHQVHVFTAEKDVARCDLTLHRRKQGELTVDEVVQNLYLHRFRETWDHPGIDALFGKVLDEVRPDVVHIHHLLYLSTGVIAQARSRGIRVVMTLHDFWLECPRFGQLVHGDGSICHEVDFTRCGTCLPSFPWRQSNLARTVGRVVAGVNKVTGMDLSGVARTGGRVAPAGEYRSPSAGQALHYRAQAETRDLALRERVVPNVDQFLAPSRFLADRLIAWGIPSERMAVLPSGVDRERFGQCPRVPRGERLRVRFLGTQVHLKGPHVLLEAWERLTAEQRDRAELSLHGPDEFQPDYVASLSAHAARVGAVLGGALDREGVAAALAATDLLVVPSLWFENRPLVILEALAARTPLCVSDLGGMVELVPSGDSGWRFPAGDAAALADRLAQLIEDPSALDQLPFTSSPDLLPSWEEVAATHAELYAP